MSADDPHPTLLVPGFAGGTTLFLPFRDALRQNDVDAACWNEAPFVYRKSIGHYGHRLAQAILAHPSDRLTLVGWSMGGFVSVEAMRYADAALKVRRVIAYATPYDGTWAARLGRPLLDPLGFHLREMVPGSAEIASQVEFLGARRSWDFIAINGERDWLARGPLKAIDPAWCVDGDFDHRSLLWNPALFALIHSLILKP